jgi:hypothetical protein
MAEPVEAIELYNYLQNERRYYQRQTQLFRTFEFEIKWQTHVYEYNEARLFPIAHDAAQGYTREYIGRDAKYLEHFPLNIIRECAKLMANEFAVEKAAGNSWL